MPWSGTAAPYGFGAGTGQPWLPMPDDWADLTVEAQRPTTRSTLAFFRRMLRLRREVTAGLPDEVELLDTAPGHVRVPARRPGLRGQLRLADGAGCRPRPASCCSAAAPTRSTAGIAPDTAAWFRATDRRLSAGGPEVSAARRERLLTG